jgi:hypothetical protein
MGSDDLNLKSAYFHVVTDAQLTPKTLRERLAVHEEIIHSTIELHQRSLASAKPASSHPIASAPL